MYKKTVASNVANSERNRLIHFNHPRRQISVQHCIETVASLLDVRSRSSSKVKQHMWPCFCKFIIRNCNTCVL